MADKSLLVRTLKGEAVERVPVWFMRQAGRFLPEYRELRANHRMLDLIRDPHLASQVTLQPLKRFNLDGAIIFADILNPLMTLGIELDFIEGEGPKIFNPLQKAEDVERLKAHDISELKYTAQAIELCVKVLGGTPVLGFSGAPFTLSAYMIEGGRLGDLQQTKHFMFSHPKAWDGLQQRLIALITDYALMQEKAGASAIQLFDSWAGYLARAEYESFVLPSLKKLISDLRRVLSVPLIYFSTGTAGMLDVFSGVEVDAISVDWRTSLRKARAELGSEVVLQGNLDPVILSGPPEYLARQTAQIVKEGKECGKYIFNLGHGILPNTPHSNVQLAIEVVLETGRY